MTISSFDDLLQAARSQPEPQRLLFVFAGVELPDDATPEQRTRFDLEMLSEVGHCKGIENYSRHLAGSAPGLTATVLATAAQVAQQEGLGDQFRLVFNTGTEAGQSVFHVHGHVLGGRDFTWPPG